MILYSALYIFRQFNLQKNVNYILNIVNDIFGLALIKMILVISQQP